MSPLALQLNALLGTGTLILEAGAILLLIALFARRRGGFFAQLSALASSWAFPVSFFLVFVSVGFSLFYSEVLGFVPCGLCWLQRVFLYPQVFLLGVALWKNERVLADYIIALSVPGALVALYQHYLQLGGGEFLPCPAAGGDCAKIIMFEFGHITYPFMTLVLFAFVALLMLHARSAKKAGRGH